MRQSIILMQEKQDKNGNPDEPYLCTLRHFLGMKILGRVVWWRFDFSLIIWQLKQKRK